MIWTQLGNARGESNTPDGIHMNILIYCPPHVHLSITLPNTLSTDTPAVETESEQNSPILVNEITISNISLCD